MKLESIKTLIFIAAAAVGVTIYAHEMFATNKKVDEIAKEQVFQNKVSCLIARKLKIKESKLDKICKFNF